MTQDMPGDRERELRLNVVFLEEAIRSFKQVSHTIDMCLKNNEIHLESRSRMDVHRCIKSLNDSLQAMSLELTQKIIACRKAGGNN